MEEGPERDKPVSELTAEEVGEVARAIPEEYAYIMAHLKFRANEPVPVEWLDWALEMELWYPHPIGYYAARAAVARERRLLAERLATSAPFT